MMQEYPEGKKGGTNYYWRGSLPEIVHKLKTVMAKYNFTFTKEQATNATKKYVESFNGDYKLMHLLKYFILKRDRETGDMKSEFMSYVTNENQVDSNNDSWQTHLV